MPTADELIIRIVTVGGAAAAGEIEGVSKAGKKMGGAFKAFTGLAVADAMYHGVKAAAQFRSSMLLLQTQTGATHKEMVRASNGILHMASSVGQGPMSLSQAMYHMESAGIRGKRALNGLRIAAEGADIGHANLTDTTTALTAVQVAHYKHLGSLKSIMGELNATVGSGDMTMTDLDKALSTGVLGTFKQIGLHVNDLGAGLAVLGDNNIRGAAAATRLRMGLMSLVKPSEASGEVMANIGINNPLQLAGDLRHKDGLVAMLKDLQKHTQGLSKTQKAADLAGIFGGGRNSAAMLLLINEMGRLQTKYKQIHSGAKDFNADWNLTRHSLSFVGDQIKAFADVQLIKLGNALIKVGDYLYKNRATLLEIAKILAPLIAAYLAWKTIMVVLSIAQGIQTAITSASIVSYIGLALSVRSVSDAQRLLNAALDANPIGVIIGVLVALGLAFYEVYKHCSLFRHIVQDVWTWIKGHWPYVLAFFIPILGIPLLIVKKWSVIKQFFKGLWADIVHIVAIAIDSMIGQINKIINGFDSIASHKFFGVRIGFHVGDLHDVNFGHQWGHLTHHTKAKVVGTAGLDPTIAGPRSRISIITDRGAENPRRRVLAPASGIDPAIPVHPDTVTYHGTTHVHVDVDGRNLLKIMQRQTAQAKAAQ
jgi:TP901 family phage tail tape measure protein